MTRNNESDFYLWFDDLHAITTHSFLLLLSLYISETAQSLHRRPESVETENTHKHARSRRAHTRNLSLKISVWPSVLTMLLRQTKCVDLDHGKFQLSVSLFLQCCGTSKTSTQFYNLSVDSTTQLFATALDSEPLRLCCIDNRENTDYFRWVSHTDTVTIVLVLSEKPVSYTFRFGLRVLCIVYAWYVKIFGFLFPCWYYGMPWLGLRSQKLTAVLTGMSGTALLRGLSVSQNTTA